MIFKQLNPGSCRTYLIGSERTKEVGIIDPILEGTGDILSLVNKEGLTLRWVLDTHTHADHLSGCALIRDKTGVDYLMHRDSRAACVSRKIESGETLGLGELAVRFEHAPGHTADSLIVVLPDRFLSGDFLFIGPAGAGRLDLPGGDVGAHYESLRKLDALPDEAGVFPAHDYQGIASSTLKAERASNPVLRPKSREEYLKWWESLRFGPAEWMKEVVRANVAGTRVASAVKIPQSVSACQVCAPAPKGGVLEWSPSQVAESLKTVQPLLLDVRGVDEYGGELGHIQGSRLIPLPVLADHLEELPKDRAIVTVCRSGNRSGKAAVMLQQMGFHKVYSMAGGMMAWNEAGLPVQYSAV